MRAHRDILRETDPRHCQLQAAWRVQVHHDVPPLKKELMNGVCRQVPPTSLGPPTGSLPARRRLEVSRLAHNKALSYLANHDLTDEQRAQLVEVVHGFTGPCDQTKARLGLKWMCERYRRRGQTSPF
jgi:hypothetical protein